MSNKEPFHIFKQIMTLPAGALKSDAKFQREINSKRVAEIAANFNESKWDYPVIKIIDKEYQIQDGQHRVAAIIARFGKDTLIDCFVEKGEYQDAAIGFAEQDVGKKALSKFDKFNALVEGNDPVATDILRIVNSHGLILSNAVKNKAITAVGLCEKLYSKMGAYGFNRILKIITESFGTSKEALSSSTIRGVAAFLSHYAEGQDFQINTLISQLQKTTYSKLNLEASKRVCGSYDSSFALEMVKEYNKVARKNKRLDPGRLFLEHEE